jgi:hypothetical protein
MGQDHNGETAPRVADTPTNADNINGDVDPEEFLRALLKITPEDAEAARKDADQHRPPSARTKKDDPAD